MAIDKTKGGIVTTDEALNLIKKRRVFVRVCSAPDFYIRVYRKDFKEFLEDPDASGRPTPLVLEILPFTDSSIHFKITNKK